jgi:hypothetical protein
VFEAIIRRLPISLEIALVSIALAAAVGITIGVMAAASSSPKRSRALALFMGTAQAVPVYLSATLLIWLFAVTLRWSRASGWIRLTDSLGGNLGALILPAVALAFAEVGYIARTVKADVTHVCSVELKAPAPSPVQHHFLQRVINVGSDVAVSTRLDSQREPRSCGRPEVQTRRRALVGGPLWRSQAALGTGRALLPQS